MVSFLAVVSLRTLAKNASYFDRGNMAVSANLLLVIFTGSVLLSGLLLICCLQRFLSKKRVDTDKKKKKKHSKGAVDLQVREEVYFINFINTRYLQIVERLGKTYREKVNVEQG